MSDRSAQIRSVAVSRPSGEGAPLVLDSPHSGTTYPEDFGHAVAQELLHSSEDRLVDDLFSGAPALGATLVRALFARSYIDPNRSVTDIDRGILSGDWPEALEPGPQNASGFGLIFSKTSAALPIYDRLIDPDAIRWRIENYWRPYHDALEAELSAWQEKAGTAWHLDCHSMQPVGSNLAPDPGRVRPDVVLGDLDGTSCEPEFTAFAVEALRDLGLSVRLNDPYRGAYLVQRHGRPAEGRHSLQIELNRALYMNQDDLQPHAGLSTMQLMMTRFTGRLVDFVRDRVGQ